MKYALTASITFIISLLIVIGYLLAQMTHSSLSCQFRTTFNQSELVMQVAEGLPQGVTGESQDKSGQPKPGKKPPVPPPSAGIYLNDK